MFAHSSNNSSRVEFFHLPVTSHIAASLAQLFLQSSITSSANNSSTDHVSITRLAAAIVLANVMYLDAQDST